MPPRPLPRIVIAITEFAHLMRLAASEVEESICRLAQMSRAAGIHMLISTARSSADIVTGLIKASLPARISFRQPTKRESRAILDANGAESLLGRGDMLFRRPSAEGLIRLHGPWASYHELARRPRTGAARAGQPTTRGSSRTGDSWLPVHCLAASHALSGPAGRPSRICPRSRQIAFCVMSTPASAQTFIARAASGALMTREPPNPVELATRIPRSS